MTPLDYGNTPLVFIEQSPSRRLARWKKNLRTLSAFKVDLRILVGSSERGPQQHDFPPNTRIVSLCFDVILMSFFKVLY